MLKPGAFKLWVTTGFNLYGVPTTAATASRACSKEASRLTGGVSSISPAPSLFCGIKPPAAATTTTRRDTHALVFWLRLWFFNDEVPKVEAREEAAWGEERRRGVVTTAAGETKLTHDADMLCGRRGKEGRGAPVCRA